jgi:hypothetical protein
MFHFALSFLLISGPAFAEPEDAPEETTVEAPAEAEAEAPAEEEAPADAEEAESEVPETLDEAAEDVSLLVKAVQEKHWGLVIGLLLSLLVFVANKLGLKNKVGSKAVPWVTAGLAVSATVGAGLVGGISVAECLSQGLIVGVAAIGGWEMIFKHVLGSPSS